MGTESDKPELGVSKIDRKILKILFEPNGHLKNYQKYINEIRNTCYYY